jgi:hypothetical protein
MMDWMGYVVSGVLVCLSWTAPRQDLLTDAPDTLQLAGIVCDDQGQAIDQATVCLIAPGGGSFLGGQFGSEPFPFLQTQTDRQGRFLIECSATDARLSRSSPLDPLWLVVSHPQHTIRVQTMEPDRLTVALPCQITLPPAATTQLTVLDGQGQPIPGASVQVAQYDGRFVPRLTPVNPGSVTNAAGEASLSGYAPDRLQHVYVVSETHGNQVVPLDAVLTPNGPELFCRLAPTGRIAGQVRLPDSMPAADFEGLVVDVWTISDRAIEQPGAGLRGWCRPQVGPDGRFEAPHVALGSVQIRLRNLGPISLRMPGHAVLARRTLDEPGEEQRVELALEPAQLNAYPVRDSDGQLVTGIVFADDNDLIEREELRVGSDGELRFWHGVGDLPAGGLLPTDPLTRYLAPRFSGVDLRRLAAEADGAGPLITLLRTRSLRGQTVDATGEILAGAEVSFSYQHTPWTQQRRTFSDQAGQFELRGLPPGVSVRVWARRGEFQTVADQAVDRLAGDPQPLELVLKPTAVTTLSGRILDALNQPIPNARVAIQRGQLLRSEGTLGEVWRSEGWSPDQRFLLTDHTGLFQMTTVVNPAEKVRLQIDAHGYQPRCTPFRELLQEPTDRSPLSLGTQNLLPKPVLRVATVTIVDGQSQQPVVGVDVVCSGQYTTGQQGQTDASGRFQVLLSDRPQVLAAWHPQYEATFVVVERWEPESVLTLRPRGADYETPREDWATVKAMGQGTDQATARAILDRLPEVNGQSTVFRQTLYTLAAAAADPSAMVQSFQREDFPFANREFLWSLALPSLAEDRSESFLDAARSPWLSVPTQIQTLLTAAAKTTDRTLQQEILGEAVLLAEAGGIRRPDDQSMALEHTARSLLMLGYIDEAKRLIGHHWKQWAEVQAILESGEYRSKSTINRRWFPLLAVVDLPATLQLIRLTCDADDQRELLSRECVVWAAIFSADQFPTAQTLDSADGPSTNANFLARDLRTFGPPSGPVLNALLAVVDRPPLPSPLLTQRERLFVHLIAMAELPAGPLRRERLRDALQIWREMRVLSWFGSNDPAGDVLAALAQTKRLAPAERDALIFEALRKAPAPQDSRFLIEVATNTIRLLALRDPALAKPLLESMFHDGSWHLGIETDQTLFRNPALMTAAWVDAQWALGIAEAVAADYGPEAQSHHLEIYSALLEGLAERRNFDGTVVPQRDE